MIFKNNQISMDTDAEHLARAQMMAVGVVTYGDELDFSSDQIDEYETYATDIYDALNSQHEESADADEAFVAVKAKHEETLAKYRACQSVIKGEMEFASERTREYLDERFDIEDDVPRSRKGFLKMAEFMVSAFDAIAVEHPDVELPPSRFEELRTLVDELHAAMEAVGKELAEQKEATVSKDVLRNTTGEKLMRKCYHRALAYWGDDDPRLLELGLVPVSSIHTPGEPPVTEFTATVTRVDVGEWDFWCSRPEGVEDAKIDLLMLPDGPMIVLIEQMLVEEGKFVQHRSSDIGPGSYKAIFTAFDASGAQVGDVVAVEFTEEG